MSKTFTSRPAVVRNPNPNINNRNQTGAIPKANASRGRGRGRGTMATGLGRGSVSGIGRGRENSTENAEPQAPALDQRMSYQGGFTMITPNEKRKQEIQKQAERETANFQQYKEQRKVGHMSYVGTAGGGELTQEQARNKLIQENKNPSMRLREKREEYRSQQKTREEEEINQKRNRQRELAEKNKARQVQSDSDQRRKWDEDRKRKTDEFLSRLEAKPTQGSSRGGTLEARTSDLQIDSSASASNIPAALNDSTPIDAPSAWGNSHSSRVVQDDIDTLQRIFPYYDRTVLQDILEQTQSVEAAIEMLHG